MTPVRYSRNYAQKLFTNKRLKMSPHPLQADNKDEKGHCWVVIDIFYSFLD